MNNMGLECLIRLVAGRKYYYISIKIESGRRTNIGAATLIYAGNEPKSVLARD